MNSKLRAYYRLTKPGIIYGNLLMLIGGYLFGAKGSVDWTTLFGVVTGTALVIASGCVVNNYVDRDIDVYMQRTKKRALVTGTVSGRRALVYAVCLGVVGFLFLATFTNALTVFIGATGLFSYALVYSYVKRHSIHATLIGTIPGALPPMAGYVAATNQLDTTAWILFSIMVFWQMVHFYAIAIFRIADYKKAKIPVMPAVKGVPSTIIQMNIYAVAYLLAILALAFWSYASFTYLAVMLVVSGWWLSALLHGFRTTKYTPWARKVFLRSLFILPTLSLMLAINIWLP